MLIQPIPSLPKLTKAVILACVGVFCLALLVPGLDAALVLWPMDSTRFGLWQVVSYALLHGNVLHLFFNMLGVFMFGPLVEVHLGWRRYGLLVLVSVLTAALTQLVVQFANFWPPVPLVGYSGGLYGTLLVVVLVYGERVIVPVLPPIPLKLKTWVAIFAGMDLLSGYSGGAGLAHFAHLGGVVGAFGLMWWWRRVDNQKRPRGGHLRRVH